MPQVEGELWQIHLNIRPVLVPSQERRDGKAVAIIPLPELSA